MRWELRQPGLSLTQDKKEGCEMNPAVPRPPDVGRLSHTVSAQALRVARAYFCRRLAAQPNEGGASAVVRSRVGSEIAISVSRSALCLSRRHQGT